MFFIDIKTYLTLNRYSSWGCCMHFHQASEREEEDNFSETDRDSLGIWVKFKRQLKEW